jgi:OmcA/MtrC family decaheme c-type cytochrome
MRQTTGSRRLAGRQVTAAALAVVALCALISACSGTTGAAGAAGATGSTGPTGPTTTGTAVNISTATAITGKVTGVAIGGPPIVKFQLTDQNGTLVQGLPAADLGFAIAQLVPGLNGASSRWNSYIYSSVIPTGCPSGAMGCDTTPQIQATVEAATAGTFVDNGDGTYQYTFKTDITKVPNVVYDANLTHRIGFEIRGLAQANNASYTFQPSTGATTGIFMREIVDTATCDGCHTMLSEHGGARVEVQYCVMCHNPGTTDPYSGNSLDMKVMIHKLHTGSSLPSIQTANGANTAPTLNQGYWIVGYGKSLDNFNTVVFPQDTRNCTTCHVQTHTNLTQAANYMTVPNMGACGSCHDTINFATGANHSSSNIVADDTQCTTCHGSTSTIDNGRLQVVAAHVIPEFVFQKRISYNIVKASNTAPGQKPVIQFSVTDPTNGNKPWNLVTDEPFAYCTNANFGEANLSLAIAWSTTDYTNVGSGVISEAAEPISLPVTCAATPPTANGDGTYTITSPTAIPANIKGSAGILFEGHPAHDFGDGTGAQEIPVPNTVSYAPITDSAAVPRREVAAVANCNTCHYQLNGHGNNRVDSVQACSFCHNPNATDVVARIGAGVTPANPDPTDHLAEQSMDLKVMIHAIHASAVRTADAGTPYILYHNGSVHNFSTLGFSGLTNNCVACHDANTYYPPDPTTSTVLASTVSTYVNGVGNSGPAGQTAVTAATAACSACHQSVTEKTHMMQNGGSFTAVKDANSHVVSTETCSICHGPGGVADVKVVHNLALYQ